jgi:hypothetical protein
MLYEVKFLKDGQVLDRFTFEAATPRSLKRELTRIRSEFRARRPGAKEIMSVQASWDPANTGTQLP